MKSGCRVSKVKLKASGTEIIILPPNERTDSSMREAYIEALGVIDEFGEPHAMMSIMIWPDGGYSTIYRISDDAVDTVVNNRTMLQMLSELENEIKHNRAHGLF